MSGELLIDWLPLSPYRAYFNSLPLDSNINIDFGKTIDNAVEYINRRLKLYYKLGLSVGYGYYESNIIVISDYCNIDKNIKFKESTIRNICKAHDIEYYKAIYKTRLFFVIVKSCSDIYDICIKLAEVTNGKGTIIKLEDFNDNFLDMLICKIITD